MEVDLVGFVTYLYGLVTFDTFLRFAILYFFIVWISVLLWVMKDISNRTNSIILQVISVLIILILTPFWIFVYLIIRPSNTLFEKYYNEIEENLDIFHQIIEDRINDKWNKSEKLLKDDDIINLTKKWD